VIQKRVKVQQVTANTLLRNKKVAKQRKVTSVKVFNASCVNHIPKIDSKCLGAKRLREKSGGYVKLVEQCNEEVQKCVDLHRDLLSSGKSPVISHRDAALRIFPQFSGFTFFRTEKKKGSRGEWNVENAHWKQMDDDEIVDYLTDNISSRYKTAVERLRLSFRKENERNQKVELFGDLLERAAKDSWGASMEEKEAGFTVRKANFDSKINGRWAPYGRMLPLATDRILRDILQLNRSDTFVDIGHGLGNAVLQAAYTIGCESRGIEIVDERFLLSEVLRDQLETVIGSMSSGARKSMGSGGLKKGKVRLVCGGLEMKEHRDFLSCASGGGVVKAFADNFNGVFAARCSTGDKVWLDHSIAGLFALMPPGSKLVTLHELSIMPSRSVANAERVDRKKLTASSEASFYEMETVVLGKANECLSWSSKGSNEQDVILYVYTRLAQKSPGAVFLCANPNCKHSQSEAPLCATKTVTDKDGIEKLVLNDSCPNCNQNLRPSRSRMIKEEKPRMVKEDKPRMIKEEN
jgi:Histone methylation protein DOT1